MQTITDKCVAKDSCKQEQHNLTNCESSTCQCRENRSKKVQSKNTRNGCEVEQDVVVQATHFSVIEIVEVRFGHFLQDLPTSRSLAVSMGVHLCRVTMCASRAVCYCARLPYLLSASLCASLVLFTMRLTFALLGLDPCLTASCCMSDCMCVDVCVIVDSDWHSTAIPQKPNTISTCLINCCILASVYLSYSK